MFLQRARSVEHDFNVDFGGINHISHCERFVQEPRGFRHRIGVNNCRKLLVETILFFVSRNRTRNTFVTGRGREILVEHEIRDMVTRFGP